MGLLNETTNVKELSGVAYYFSIIPKFLTEKTVSFLSENNIVVTQRWMGMLLAFFSIGLIFFGIKVLEKVNIFVKIILVALGIILISGLCIPSW